MSDHLPECPLADPVCNSPWNFDGTHLENKGGCMRQGCQKPCICNRLRACEQRVREEENRNVIGSVSLAAIGEANVQQYHRGYDAGLDAAEAAVAACGNGKGYIYSDTMTGVEWALDAIRTLKEKP